MKRVSYEVIIDEISEFQYDTCKECNSKVELVIKNYCIIIDGIHIEIENLPQLQCVECNNIYLSEKSKIHLKRIYEQLKMNNQNSGRFVLKKINKIYGYCKEINFDYDYRDYENIPGLINPNKDGFLTPVFFEKDSLIYFMHHSQYELNVFSETYGNLKYKDEFIIPFGINKYEKVIFWLGDLDGLDMKTIELLKIHNVPSDHTLIETEFYDAQIKCIFSEPIIEKQIINLRNKLYDNLKINYGLELHHLDEEVLKVLDDIKKPITYCDLEIKSVIGALHKILIEAVNVKNFKEYYENMVEGEKRAEDWEKWRSIKYFEFLLSQLIKEGEINIKEKIASLYLLNDLRILYNHLVSEKEEKKLKDNIDKTLNLRAFEDNNEELYNTLIVKLKDLFNFFVKKTS